MSNSPVYILGGYQTDFAVNYAKQGKDFFNLFQDCVTGLLDAVPIEPTDIQTAHVGNFIGELTCHQGHFGAFFAETHPAFRGLPTSRHEAACASGSVAALAAMAEIEAGRYETAAVLGIEMERNIPAGEAASHLGVAAWRDKECHGVQYPWPKLFSDLADEYAERYGLDYKHLARIAQVNIENARANPNAQTRKWSFNGDSFSENDEHNPVIEGRIRRQDCSQLTDGAAAIILASERYAAEYAQRRGIPLEALPRIMGWGHRTAPMLFTEKVAESKDQPYVFPHVRRAIQDAFQRAGIREARGLDGIETHDCFTPTEYMAIDHFGITAPGKSWRAIEDGVIERTGELPVNPSGGLIGAGHPVGASGVRMLLDAAKQVTGTANGYQVEDARRFATLNIGGSGTTICTFVVGRD